jgi:hypothetical protein
VPGFTVVVAATVVVSSAFKQATADTRVVVGVPVLDEVIMNTMFAALIGSLNCTTIGWDGLVTVIVLDPTGFPLASRAVYCMVLTLLGLNVKLTYSGGLWPGVGFETVIIETVLPSTLDCVSWLAGITASLAILVRHGCLGVVVVGAVVVVPAVEAGVTVVPGAAVVGVPDAVVGARVVPECVVSGCEVVGCAVVD